jgi:quinoprotein glucose dehydrogenase
MRFSILLLSVWFVSSTASFDSNWSSYGHDAGGTRYSPLKQINVQNVSKLKVARMSA